MKSFQQRDDKKSKSDRKLFRCSDLNYLIGESLKPPRNKDQKAFVGGGWSDSENIGEDKINDETCLMAQSSNESPSCKIGLGFDKSTTSTSRTKPTSFVGSSAEMRVTDLPKRQTDPPSLNP
ncbi:hypothetical protein Tco_1121330 [Tanacetum coccineum]|uniref:Uncharacterized protein n=1 Tax=Tanacetum coccineum TaxID=301880 RepID=A0ABQ5IYT3_9ASTR